MRPNIVVLWSDKVPLRLRRCPNILPDFVLMLSRSKVLFYNGRESAIAMAISPIIIGICPHTVNMIIQSTSKISYARSAHKLASRSWEDAETTTCVALCSMFDRK